VKPAQEPFRARRPRVTFSPAKARECDESLEDHCREQEQLEDHCREEEDSS
jgi:hypothetical protein